MAGGTHAFDMIKRLRENENLRKLNYFKKPKPYPTSGGVPHHQKRDLTKEETIALRNSIRKDQRKETLRWILILFVSVVLCGALILIFGFSL